MKPLKRIIKPIERFIHFEAAGGIVLMIVAVISFICANSELSDLYFSLVKMPVTFAAGESQITHSLVFWINDALMVLFFFVVGLEIKREMVSGELNTRSKAAFPAIAAAGGAIVPAIIFAIFNMNSPTTLHGWGIPMATDIAFAVGVLALFGNRVPGSLKIFLLALAIVDDLIAVIVIAIFYTAHLNLVALGAAGFIFFFTYALKQSNVTNYIVYFLLGVGAWVAVFASGVHATIAGVVLGLMTPLTLPDSSQKPVEELLHFFHPWVAFIIMPLFAFFNAGVKIDMSTISESLTHPVTLGVAVGLIFGKPIGIYFSVLWSKKLGWITLPHGISMTKILAVGFLGGIGFTMSLFVASLSFKVAAYEDYAKVGILMASLVAAIAGSFCIYLATRKTKIV